MSRLPFPSFLCCYQACEKPISLDLPKEATSENLGAPGIKNIVTAVPWTKHHPGYLEDSTEDTDAIENENSDSASVQWPRLLAACGDHPLLAALRLHAAHLVGFQQELLRFAASCGDTLPIPSDRELDMLRRLVIQYDSALGPKSVAATRWLIHERSSSPACEYGAVLAGDIIQWFRIIEMDGCDIVKGFAAFLEVDLMRNFADDLICADPLGMHTARRNAGWRSAVRTRPYYVKEDNVWLYHALDALDSPIAALLIFTFTPPRPKITGVPVIPSPEHGFERSDFECLVHHFEPIMDEGAFGPTGFRLTQLGISRPSSSSSSKTSIATAVQCIKDGTGDTAKFINKYRRYVESSCHLEARMKASPRTELYDKIQKHVDDLWPCVASA
jgi:hypothetical protein